MGILKKTPKAEPVKAKPVSAATKKGRQGLNDRLALQRKLDKDGNIK